MRCAPLAALHGRLPRWHSFSGYVCCEESEKLGMLAITEQDGESRLTFVYAMPKIHYPKPSRWGDWNALLAEALPNRALWKRLSTGSASRPLSRKFTGRPTPTLAKNT